MGRRITFWYTGAIASKSNYRFGYNKAARDRWSRIREYETKIGELANEAMVEKGYVSRRGDVAVHIVAYNQRPDIDNLFKSTLDAMEGICYLKDSQVSLVSARRKKDKKGKRARITVRWL